MKRAPRKLIRLAKAAEILQESRQTVKNRIHRGELIAVQERPGTTTPIRVFEAQTIEIAKRLGIL